MFQAAIERFQRIPDYLPWLSYDDGTGLFLLDGNYIGVAFGALPLSGFDPTIEQRFNALLTSDIPAGAFLQFNLMVFDDVSAHLNDLHRLRSQTQDRLIAQTTRNTVEFLKKGALGELDMAVRNAYQIVSLKMPINDTLPTEDEIDTANRLARELKESLQTIGFRELRQLDDTELLYQLSIALNRTPHAAWRAGRTKPDPSRLLRDQIVDYDNPVTIRRKNIEIGDTIATQMSVKKVPNRSYFGLAERFSWDPKSGDRGIPCAHMFSCTIKIQDIIDERPKIERRKHIMGHYARGPFGNVQREYGRRHADLQLVDDRIADGDFVHRFALSLTLFSRPEDVSRDTTRAGAYLSELGFVFLIDTCVAFPILRASLPLGAEREDQGNFSRLLLQASSAIATFIPAFFDWRGSKSPLMSLVARSGQIMGFDPFESDTNYNFTLSAESGGGKSFFSNEMIAATLGAGGRVWVIDVGRSYVKLCETLDGQFLCFDRDNDICLNPFSSIESDAEFDEVQDILLHLLASMAAPKDGLSDFQSAALHTILREQFMEHRHELSIDHIAKACFERAAELSEGQDGEFKEKRISDVGYGLKAFCSDGQYGRYFNGPSTIDFRKKFVLLELEELKSQKHLQTVVLLLLIYQIQQGMYRGTRDHRKLLLIDEAWDLLSDPKIAGFIEAGYRRFRKYNGSAGIITQALTDLHHTTTGQAILANSATTIMLNQKPATLDKLAKGDNAEFPAGLCERLKTIHTKPGHYSEVFISTSAGAGIGRFVVDDYRKLLYSTRPQDVADIERYTKRGMHVDDAIKAVIEERRGA